MRFPPVVTALLLIAGAVAPASAQPPTSATVWTWCAAAYPGELAPVWVQIDARRPRHDVDVIADVWTPDGSRIRLAELSAIVDPGYPFVISVADALPLDLPPGDYTIDTTVTDRITGETLRHASTITVLDPATPGQRECLD